MKHHQHHLPPTITYNSAFAIAVSLNFGFTLVEAGFALWANSMSLLADAGHNLADVLGLLMAWGAAWLLKQESGERYSYGFKKTTILAALANALLLILTTALIVYESIAKLLQSVPIQESIIIKIALLGIIVNGSTALLFNKGRDQDLNIQGAFLHLATDALISFGVVITGIVLFYTHLWWLDPLIGLAIVLIILWGTWGLLRDSVNLILDAIPNNIDYLAVRQYLNSLPGVQDVHDLHIWGLSTHETALTAHLVMPDKDLSDADHEAINHTLIKRFHIQHVTLQVEKGHFADPCGQVGTC